MQYCCSYIMNPTVMLCKFVIISACHLSEQLSCRDQDSWSFKGDAYAQDDCIHTNVLNMQTKCQSKRHPVCCSCLYGKCCLAKVPWSSKCIGQEADLHHGVVASCQKRAGGITQAHTDIHALRRHIGQSDVHSIQKPGEACADQLQRHTSRQLSSGLNQQNSLPR